MGLKLRASVRTRLTLWYVGIFGVLLLLYIVGASLLQSWELRNELYHAEVQDMETVEGLLYFAPGGKLELHEEYHNRIQDKLLVDRLMEVMTPGGTVLYRNRNLGERDLGGAPFAGEGRGHYDRRRVCVEGGVCVLLISHIHAIDGKTLLIRLAYDTAPLNRRVEESLSILFLSVPLALVAAGFGGYRMALRALRPLDAMASEAEQITADRLGARLAVPQPEDEFGRMARVLNGLLERLEDSFAQLKRFTADASHELRTPLAGLRTIGEVGLEREQSAEGYRETIASMLEEVRRLTQLIESLLLISRADAGQLQLHKTSFRWMELVGEVIGVLGILAEERGQQIVTGGDGEVWVEADRTLLGMAMGNMIDNALKYSPAGSMVRVTLGGDGEGGAELVIEDGGESIPMQARGKIFDRFYRADEGRSRDGGGTGLGLAIAKWAVEANGGSVGLLPGSEPGNRFFIRMPVQPRG